MSVYAKLQACRVKSEGMSIKKSGHNKFAGYQYFEIGDFLAPINQLFSDAGLCSVVSFSADLATLRVVDVEDKSEIIFTSPMAEANLKGCHPIQNLGAVETYQRRYLYMLALEIVEHDALDASEPIKDSMKTVSAHTVDELDEKAPGTKVFLKDLADDVLSLLPDEAAMYKAYEKTKATLDADEQIAWWSFFDSKSRAALKRAKSAERDAQQLSV